MTTDSLDWLDRGADRPPGQLDFLGNTTCPMGQLLRDGLREELGPLVDQDFRPVGHLPSGCGGVDHFQQIRQATDPGALPAITLTKGFGFFFEQPYWRRFFAAGAFRFPEPQGVNADFAGQGFEDPEQTFWLYAVIPYVFLVDRGKLGDRPIPQRWADLFGSEYCNDIVTGGTRDSVDKVPFLSLLKHFGPDGVERMAPQVKDTWHNVKIAQTAGAGGPDGAAVFLVPWFFAQCCPRTDRTSVVWPSDGAYSGPMYVLTKASDRSRLEPLVRYLTGPRYGAVSARNHYPALAPGVQNPLPAGARFDWLGWDYLRSHSMNEQGRWIDEVFRRRWGLE